MEENHQEAVKWYTLAAEQDNGEAQYLLSICYERGIGVEANDSLSFYWCQKAAKQGLLDAQYALAARYYDQAKGVGYNMKQAIHWYKVAASQGHKGAKEALRMMRILHIRQR